MLQGYRKEHSRSSKHAPGPLLGDKSTWECCAPRPGVGYGLAPSPQAGSGFSQLRDGTWIWNAEIPTTPASRRPWNAGAQGCGAALVPSGPQS